MSGWTTHTGTGVALDRDNIDTDQLIPARFMSTPRSEGYGRFLLHDLRYDAEGRERPEFALNRVTGPSVLIAGRNFGSGSSREAAVYALVDFGIRVVVAPSFGDIFASNAVNNGLLPARVDAAAAAGLAARLAGADATVQVSLEDLTVSLGDLTVPFEIDAVWREKLINGWDDIDLTRTHAGAIAAHRAARARHQPWAIPRGEAAR
ncbi:3-isopropylmalate dehydratase small subunit [Rhodobacterales bacterium HKCCSP123]|nr:3-isopropylmalate dehydratase small subunit [Rhodobacterales bacterium HKCCSP123]